MNGFMTRASKIGVWFTVGAFGLVFFLTGCVQLSAPFIMRHSIKSETKGLADGAPQVGDAMLGLATAMSLPLFAMGIITFSIGALILRLAFRRIHAAFTQPLPDNSNMRGQTALGRAIAIVIFLGGTGLGGYGVYVCGERAIDNVKGVMYYERTIATVISVDDTLVLRQTGHQPERPGKYSGIYQFETPQGLQTIAGAFPRNLDMRGPEPGGKFSVHYDKRNPSQLEFSRRGNPENFIPDALSILFVFWLISAGLTGIKVNLDPEDPEDPTAPGESYDNDLQTRPASTSVRAEGFGRRASFGQR